MDTLITWKIAKNKMHDISGIENPNDWLYKQTNGIYFPEITVANELQVEYSSLSDILTCSINKETFERYSNSKDNKLKQLALCSIDKRKVQIVSDFFDIKDLEV
jgi:hypothetical protein